MSAKKCITKTTDFAKNKAMPYSDNDRISTLLSQAEKMRAGSWKDYFHKN